MSLKVALINMVADFMMSAKLDTLGLLKKRHFQIKVAHVILSHNSNFVVDDGHMTKIW